MNCVICSVLIGSPETMGMNSTKSPAQILGEGYQRREQIQNDPRAMAAHLASLLIASNAELEDKPLPSLTIGANKVRAAVTCGLNAFVEPKFDVSKLRTDAAGLGVDENEVYQSWKTGLLGRETGLFAWRLCTTCYAAFEEWWESHIEEKTFNGTDLHTIWKQAQEQSYVVDYPLDIVKQPQRLTLSKSDGRSEKHAEEALRQAIPSEAENIADITISGGKQFTRNVLAFDEMGAWRASQMRISEKLDSDTIELLRPPTKGFLGIGRQPGRWRVVCHQDFVAQTSYSLPGSLRVARLKAVKGVKASDGTTG